MDNDSEGSNQTICSQASARKTWCIWNVPELRTLWYIWSYSWPGLEIWHTSRRRFWKIAENLGNLSVLGFYFSLIKSQVCFSSFCCAILGYNVWANELNKLKVYRIPNYVLYIYVDAEKLYLNTFPYSVRNKFGNIDRNFEFSNRRIPLISP